MYWVVMRRLGRSDGSFFLNGHMWLIRTRPRRAPDTPKMTRGPQLLFYVIFVFAAAQREKDGEEMIHVKVLTGRLT